MKTQVEQTARAAIYVADKGTEPVDTLRDFRESNGWSVVQVYVQDPTAKVGQRQEHEAVFQDAMNGGRPFEKIVVYNLSRISRDPQFLEGMRQKLLEHGVEIVPLRSLGTEDEVISFVSSLFELQNSK